MQQYHLFQVHQENHRIRFSNFFQDPSLVGFLSKMLSRVKLFIHSRNVYQIENSIAQNMISGIGLPLLILHNPFLQKNHRLDRLCISPAHLPLGLRL